MKIQYLLFILLFISCSGDDSPIDIPIETNEAIYFPPNGTDEWEMQLILMILHYQPLTTNYGRK
jgi:hypothetical protein|tara:strand:- start:335 stop:526 length:192 start_codon:yes stop_codon:yes gene_type:complete